MSSFIVQVHLARHVERQEPETGERNYHQLCRAKLSLRELCPLGKLYLVSEV
jgi:hydroxypyruvate isomerase